MKPFKTTQKHDSAKQNMCTTRYNKTTQLQTTRAVIREIWHRKE